MNQRERMRRQAHEAIDDAVVAMYQAGLDGGIGKDEAHERVLEVHTLVDRAVGRLDERDDQAGPVEQDREPAGEPGADAEVTVTVVEQPGGSRVVVGLEPAAEPVDPPPAESPTEAPLPDPADPGLLANILAEPADTSTEPAAVPPPTAPKRRRRVKPAE